MMKKPVPQTSKDRYHLQRDERKLTDLGLARGWILNSFVKKHEKYVGTCIHANSIWVRISGQIYRKLEGIV